MKKILILSILIFSLFSIGLALAPTCIVRDYGCQPDENAVFSLMSETNSHAGDYLYYNKKVCCTNVVSSYLKTTCNSDETEVMTFYKQNNSHVAKKGYAPYKLCTKFNTLLSCVVTESCTGNAVCVASVAYDTNSHVGGCNQYPKKICCTQLSVNVEAGGPYVKNQTLPIVLIVGTVTFAGESAPYSNVTIKIYEGPTLKASKDLVSSSTGKFATTFTGFDVGVYSVEVLANYSSATTSSSDTFKVIESLSGCTYKTISLNGNALDYLTGLPISSGTVKITIKENGDEFSTSFTGGRWVATFTTCLVQDRRYTAIIQITDSATGKISWSETQFISP
jgi:hypothetical protein